MDRANEIVQDYFNVLTQVRGAKTARPMPEVVHGRLSSFLERAMSLAGEKGFTQRDTQDIGYVLAALGDEVALSMDPELRDFWLPRLLQLQYFNENVAGEGVFQRIDGLLSDSNRAEVLRIYYYALLFGFQGKYRIRGGEAQLATVVDRVSASLRSAGAMQETELSPNAERPKENIRRMKRNVPLIALSIGALLFALGTYMVLRVNVSGDAEEIVEHLTAEEG